MTRSRPRVVALLALVAGIGLAFAAQSLLPPPLSVPQPAVVGEPPVDAVPWSTVDWRILGRPFAVANPPPIRIDGLAQGENALVGWGRVSANGRNQFDSMGAVFVSADGEQWRALALADGVRAGDTSEPRGVSIGPLGYLAWGGVCCGVEEQAIWLSTDALQWTRVEIGGDLAGPRTGILDVIGLSSGWVATGTDGELASIWMSRDGRTWQAVDRAEGGLGKGVVSDVATAGDRLLAVGTVDDAAATHDGAIWSSNDGIAWSRIAAAEPSLTGPDETELWRVQPFAAGLFVIGNHGAHEERVRCEQLLGATASLDGAVRPETALSCGWGREHHWLSADGVAWQRVPPPDLLPGQLPDAERPIEFRLPIPGGPGLVNLGEDNRPPEGDAALWVSVDGASWRLVETRAAAVLTGSPMGLAILDRRIVAVGESRNAEGATSVGIWIGSIQ